jgi:hypothetical protein
MCAVSQIFRFPRHPTTEKSAHPTKRDAPHCTPNTSVSTPLHLCIPLSTRLDEISLAAAGHIGVGFGHFAHFFSKGAPTGRGWAPLFRGEKSAYELESRKCSWRDGTQHRQHHQLQQPHSATKATAMKSAHVANASQCNYCIYCS